MNALFAAVSSFFMLFVLQLPPRATRTARSRRWMIDLIDEWFPLCIKPTAQFAYRLTSLFNAGRFFPGVEFYSVLRQIFAFSACATCGARRVCSKQKCPAKSRGIDLICGEGGITSAALRRSQGGGLKSHHCTLRRLRPPSFFVFHIRIERARPSIPNKKPAAKAAGAMMRLAEREGFEPT